MGLGFAKAYHQVQATFMSHANEFPVYYGPGDHSGLAGVEGVHSEN